MTRIRQVVLFSGHVQGVGFRWNVHRVAADFDVAGTVENLPDGRVRLVAEGEKRELEAFVRTIEATTSGNIREKQVDQSSARSDFSDFTIVY